MAASTAFNRQRSHESAILFMQQEHANTLKALHEEIQHLQKRCSELTFQMAMHSTSISTEDDLQEKVGRLEHELEDQTKKNAEHEERLGKKDKKILMLEQQLKAQETKFLKELKGKGKTILTLRGEVEAKANTVAYLTSQMHALKMKMKEQSSADGQVNAYHPTPPREGPPKHRRRSAGKTAEYQVSSAIRVRGPSAQKLRTDKPDTAEDIPDPTPFIRRESSSEEAELRRSKHTVLPPISKPTTEELAGIEPQKTLSHAFVKRQLHKCSHGSGPSDSTAEIETLAVDQVTCRKNTLRKAQEYKSSDFN